MEFTGVISAEAVLKPKKGGTSFLEEEIEVTVENQKKFWAKPSEIKEVVTQFKSSGFSVSTITKIGFFFSGPAHLFENSFAADGEKIEIETDGSLIFNKATGESTINISPTLFGGSVLAVLISSLAKPLKFDPITLSGWPETDKQWNTQKEIATTQKQIQMWQLPQLLKANTKTGENHLTGLEEGRWPYEYSGKGVNVHVIDTGFTENHPYFNKAHGSTYKKHWNLTENTIKSEETNRRQIYEYIGIIKLDWSFFGITDRDSVETFFDEVKQINKRQKGIKLVRSQSKAGGISELGTVVNALKVSLDDDSKLKDFINAKGKFIPFEIHEKEIENSDNEIIKKYLIIRKKINDLAIKRTTELTNEISKNPNLEFRPHGTSVTANLLAIAPEVNLNFHKSLDALFNSQNTPITMIGKELTEILNNIYKTKKPGTSIINHSFGIQSKSFSFHMLKETKNILFVTSSGNIDFIQKESKETVYENYLHRLPNYLQVGGAFYDHKNQLNYSSGAVGFKDETLRFKRYHSPDICALNGGPFNFNAEYPNFDFESMKTEHRQKINTDEQWDLNFGRLWLPGVKKVNTENFNDISQDKSTQFDFTITTGTSYSAPQIAGVCAIILEQWKTATPSQVKFIIVNSTDEIKLGKSANGVSALEMGTENVKGVGMVNIKKAIKLTNFVSQGLATGAIKKRLEDTTVTWSKKPEWTESKPTVIE